MEQYGQSLDACSAVADRLTTVRRGDICAGDVVYVRTCNSLYCIHVEERSTVRVSGGWFDRKGDAPVRTTIAGCTWGGSVIKTDVVAAVGLSLEFGNRVVTSPVQKIILLRQGRRN